MRRLLVIVSLVLFIASIPWLFMACNLPTEVEQETPLLNYEHQGRFDYLVYLKPSHLFSPESQEPLPLSPNPKYPTEIIDNIDMSFTYKPSGEASGSIDISAVLENPGIWQKEITLVPTTVKMGEFTINFPLDIDEINELFDTIDEGIKITSSSRSVTIVANVSIGSKVLTYSLPIKLGESLIEVDSNLIQTQLGSTGEFDYSIHLKENPLLDATTLKPPQVTPFTSPQSKTIGPGEVILSNLVDSMDATFYYDFKCDQPARGLTEEVTITATLENPEIWSKTFVLVPTTRESGSFSNSFAVDINYFTQTLDAIRSETGIGAESYNLVIKADVHIVAQTDFGPIDEVFSQTLSSRLGKGNLEWNEELVASTPGSITIDQVIPNPKKYLGLSVTGARILSSVLVGIFFLFFLFSVALYVRFKPAEQSWIEKEVQRTRKKYGEMITEAIIQDEKTISVETMGDLIKVASELGKPIVHQSPTTSEETHSYFVFDGTTRYQYLPNTSGAEHVDRGK